MIARRAFLKSAAGAGAAILAAPAFAVAPGRDIIFLRVAALRASPDWRSVPAIAKTASRGVVFRRAYAATASPLARDAVLHSGYYAHQLGAMGLIHDIWDGPDLAEPSPFLHETFKRLGYAIRIVRSGGPRRRRGVVAAHAPELIDISAVSIRQADAMLAAIVAGRSGEGRGDPLVVIVIDESRKAIDHRPEPRFSLVAALPGRARGVVCDDLVSSVDIMPTMLDWAGASHEMAVRPGRSLLPELITHPGSVSLDGDGDVIFASQGYQSIGIFRPLRVARTLAYRLEQRLAPSGGGVGAAVESFALYDLAADPLCEIDIADSPQHAGALRKMKARLQRWRSLSGDRWRVHIL
jgi:N-sulfoglucosamine sulfohydrolase